MRFVGVVLILLGLSMIYYLGYKGIGPTEMIADLERFFGFKIVPPNKPATSGIVPSPGVSVL